MIKLSSISTDAPKDLDKDEINENTPKIDKRRER